MNNYLIPNMVKACGILSVLADRPEGVPSAEIENLVEVPRTTAFRILKTLCSEQMVEKRGSLFFPGPALMKIGLKSLHSSQVRPLSIPFLSDLAFKTHFTAHLAVPSGCQSLILEVHDSPNPVRVASRPGTIVPLYCSSTGKVFLAFRYENELQTYFETVSLQRWTDNTIVTLAEMRKEAEKIKSDGFAIDNGEFHEDVWCLACPVRDGAGQVVAAIGVTGPSAQSRRQENGNISEYVKRAALELSGVLGYHG